MRSDGPVALALDEPGQATGHPDAVTSGPLRPVPPRVGTFAAFVNLAHVLAGSGAYLALGFLSHLIVANALSPDAFGSLAIALAVMTILQEICGTGVDEALVKYAAPLVVSDEARADIVFKAALRIKFLVNLGLATALWLSAGTLSQLLGQSGVLTLPLRWAAAGALGSSLFGISLAVLQARQRFLQYALLRPLANLLKVALLVVLWQSHSLTLVTAAAAAAVVFFLALAAVPGLTSVKFLTAAPVAGFRPGQALLVFSSWLVLAKILFAVYSRIDVLLIDYFGSSSDVATYSVASNLLFLIDLTTFSVIVSLLPEASRIHDRASLRHYVRSAMRQCAALAVLFLPIFVAIGPIVTLLYAGKYPGAPGLFRIVFWGSFATLLVHPLYLVLYARNKPGLVALVNLVQAVACAIGCWVLIPRFGVTGAAVGSLTARLCGCALILVTVGREMRLLGAAQPSAVSGGAR